MCVAFLNSPSLCQVQARSDNNHQTSMLEQSSTSVYFRLQDVTKTLELKDLNQRERFGMLLIDLYWVINLLHGKTIYTDHLQKEVYDRLTTWSNWINYIKIIIPAHKLFPEIIELSLQLTSAHNWSLLLRLRQLLAAWHVAYANRPYSV